MAGRYPKPDAERRNTNQPAFGWTELPSASSKRPAPPLPGGRDWSEATFDAWSALWTKPQATQWDADGSTLVRWAWLHEDLVEGVGSSASVSAEMRQLEDRHGLSPKAMLQLRWRIVQPEAATRPSPTRRKSTRLRVVESA